MRKAEQDAAQISIHAPREGSDLALTKARRDQHISIHAPREGSDALRIGHNGISALFLSTLPARGATFSAVWHLAIPMHFYPRSPRGERPARDRAAQSSA